MKDQHVLDLQKLLQNFLESSLSESSEVRLYRIILYTHSVHAVLYSIGNDEEKKRNNGTGHFLVRYVCTVPVPMSYTLHIIKQILHMK
jgi:hypothetical protein